MNANQAKQLLLIYRPGTADVETPQMAEALALAKSDPELGRWFEAQTARQAALRNKFRQIAPPPGLKEQIISEQPARPQPRVNWPASRFALAAALLLVAILAFVWLPHRNLGPDNTLAIFQQRMARSALGGYAMDLATNEPTPIHAYLSQARAPDFTLPTALQHVAMTGCAVLEWQDTKVSMICFRTKPHEPTGNKSDLWLFVVNRSAIQNAPSSRLAKVAKVNRLTTATWTEGDQLYMIGIEGPESDLQPYLPPTSS